MELTDEPIFEAWTSRGVLQMPSTAGSEVLRDSDPERAAGQLAGGNSPGMSGVSSLDQALGEYQLAAQLLPEKRVEAKQRVRGLLLKLGRGGEARAAW